MSDSPAITGSGVVDISVLSNGNDVGDLRIVSVEVIWRVNTIPLARLVFDDGDMPRQDFPLSDASTLAPGVNIEIKAGYDGNKETIFKGVLVKHGVRVRKGGLSTLEIECRDPAVRMTLARRNAVYTDLKDSDVAAKLIKNHSGLSADVEATSQQHAEMVQYYASDWDYLLARAEVNGQVVIVESGKVTVAAPAVNGSSALTVAWGMDIFTFDAELDACSQISGIDAAAWDPKTQKLEESTVAKPLGHSNQGDLTSKELAKVVGPETLELQSSAPIDKSQLQTWAKAAQLKAELSRIRGRMTFQGSAKAVPGALISLEGVGKRFEGDAWISAVRHTIADGEWTTEVEFGLAPEWFVETRDVEALPAAGRLPAIRGMHLGVVLKLDEDPGEAYRVQVEIPVLRGGAKMVWARLAHSQASKDCGAFQVPEIGDEVVLGFIDDDPSQPIVLGSLYNGINKPPYEMSKENHIKALVGRSQVKVELDDGRAQVKVETPAGNRVTLDDEDKRIHVEDQHGNTMTLDDSGIAMSSKKDIKIDAKGAISLSAGTNISIDAKGDIKASGMNIEHTAKTGFTAKGAASAELSASGQTTIKGAMVMIN